MSSTWTYVQRHVVLNFPENSPEGRKVVDWFHSFDPLVYLSVGLLWRKSVAARACRGERECRGQSCLPAESLAISANTFPLSANFLLHFHWPGSEVSSDAARSTLARDWSSARLLLTVATIKKSHIPLLFPQRGRITRRNRWNISILIESELLSMAIQFLSAAWFIYEPRSRRIFSQRIEFVTWTEKYSVVL